MVTGPSCCCPALLSSAPGFRALTAQFRLSLPMGPPGDPDIKGTDPAGPALVAGGVWCGCSLLSWLFHLLPWVIFLVITVLWLADHLLGDKESLQSETEQEDTVQSQDSNKLNNCSQTSRTAFNRAGSRRGHFRPENKAKTLSNLKSMSANSVSFQIRTSADVLKDNFASPGDDEGEGVSPGGATTRCTCGDVTKSRRRPKSWCDERLKEREREGEKEKEPTSVFYYLGKLVQVVGSSNVQVGNENVMYHNEAASSEDADESFEPCLHCQRRSTAERATSMTGMCDTGVHAPGDVTDTTDDSGDDTPNLTPPGTPASPEQKEQIYLEAKIRIYRAAEEHRNWTPTTRTLQVDPQTLGSKDKEHPIRRSLSKLNLLNTKKSKSGESKAKDHSVFYT